MHGRYDFKLIRGDTWPLVSFTFQNPDGSPKSVVLAQVLLQVRTAPDGVVLRSLSNGSGLDVSGAQGNQIFISEATPGGLEAGVFVYDLQITWPDFSIETPFGGQVIVESDVSQ